jgi:hypothetical protein
MGERGRDVCGIRDDIFPLLNQGRPHFQPRYPSYADEGARIDSFYRHGWPPALGHTPQSLAKAGFFYQGIADHVLCFYCDGGLKRFEVYDDPMEEHVRWFKDCYFINTVATQDVKDRAKMPSQPKPIQELPKVEKEVVMVEINKDTVCGVCWNDPIKVAFLPCGHTSCALCSTKLKDCHSCRQPIVNFLTLFY